MSRRSNSGSKGAVVVPPNNGPPPRHPCEECPDHRAFLIRSLDRCDAEMAAMCELNQSLHLIKAEIIEACGGEQVLLDMGQGLLKLNTQEDGLEGSSKTQDVACQKLCVQFLLRMKLRRRLLNRLARRLNRLSQAMDGQDVAPPPPPKYGDLRLQLNPNLVAMHAKHEKMKQDARERIQEHIRSRTWTPTFFLRTAAVKDERDSAMVEEDYQLLKEYSDAYEKKVDLPSGSVKYTILEKDHEEDFNNIRWGAGIGATHRTLSSREKEAEYKRWQQALLAKVPDQPTFDDLGMDNRVFDLEERCKRAISKNDEEQERKKVKTEHAVGDEQENKEKETDENNKEKDDNDQDKSEEDEDDDSEGQHEKEREEKAEDDNDDKSQAKKEEKKAPPKPVKAISILAVPSFHEQDFKRIRFIHADLLASSMHEHARRRIAEVTMEYNKLFRDSNEIYNRRIKIQTDLNGLVSQHRLDVGKLNNEYNIQVAIAQQRWQKRKQEWEANKAKKVMQNIFGQMPIGTNRTQNALARPDQIINQVGLSMAFLVDAVVRKVESGDDDKFEDFVPPPPPNVDGIVVDHSTGETLGQRHERMESALRRELSALTQRFQHSEEERRKAWKKVLKTKAEFDAIQPGRNRYDPSLNPLPPLRAGNAAPVSAATTFAQIQIAPPPQPPPTSQPAAPVAPVASVAAAAVAAAAVAGIPQIPTAIDKVRFPNTALTGSDSKYSAAKVRERISSDGTVMPVSEPKRTKDGLFQRPAGRTRKGMSWDPVRGIWVPVPDTPGACP